MTSSLTPPAQAELNQLLAILAYHRQTGWLDRDDFDDQHRFLVLCYLMQAMSAKHVVDMQTVVNPRVGADTATESGLGSFWVYGLEVVDENGAIAFVGVNGERSREEAERSVVSAHVKNAEPWRRPLWEGGKSAFPSLEHAEMFYRRKTYKSLERLVGEGRAHLQAMEIVSPQPAIDPPRTRL